MRTGQYTFFLGRLGPDDFAMDVTLAAQIKVTFPSIGGNKAALSNVAAYERNQLDR